MSVQRVGYCGLLALSISLAGCAIGPSPPSPPVETVWMSGTFAALKDQLFFFACLSDKAYGPGDGTPADSDCDALIPEAALERHHPSVPGRPGETADYVIMRGPGEQYVAIRGTNPKRLQDLVIDASLSKPLPDDPLRVRMHSGFRAYAAAVLQDLRTHARLDPQVRTYLAGHSLGGAAALIVALELHFSTPPAATIQSVFTYGQPRVFDNLGATAWPEFSRRVYRVVSCRDPVPMVPRGDGLLDELFDFRLLGVTADDYQHMGQEILLMDGGAYWIPGDLEVWLDYHRNVDSLIRDLVDGRTIDHAIHTYEARLGEAMRAGARGPVNPGFENPCGSISPRLADRPQPAITVLGAAK